MISCTDNFSARRLGGTQNITLTPGQRLINITWKDQDDLWILTKTDTSQPPTVYEFSQKTGVGFMEGTVIIKEN